MKKNAASQEDKRKFCSDDLTKVLQGDNLLSHKLNKIITTKIEQRDREALLDRIMKIEDPMDNQVFLASLITDPYCLEPLEVERTLFQHCSEVQLFFKHFVYPSVERDPENEGGWKSNNMKDPDYRAWQQFCQQYLSYLMQGSANQENMRTAVREGLPIDVAFSVCPVEGTILRFMVLQPYPEKQIGFDVFY